STITSRTSAAVRPTMAMRRRPCRSTCSRTHSAPVLVFPNPRPARMSHIRHGPSGGNCFGRAQNRQSYSSASASSSDSSARSLRRSSAGSAASLLASESPLGEFVELFGQAFPRPNAGHLGPLRGLAVLEAPLVHERGNSDRPVPELVRLADLGQDGGRSLE